MECMIPENLKERLIQAGYDSIDSFPFTPDSSRWEMVKQDCSFTNPDVNRVILALFPHTAPLDLSNIHIAGRNDFPCPIGRTVEEVEERIRSIHLLTGGGILRNGVALFPNDVITLEGDYHFVDFQEQQQDMRLIEEEISFSDLNVWNEDTMSTFEQRAFKKSLVSFYGRSTFCRRGKLKCMLTDQWYDKHLVFASHIWKSPLRGRYLHQFGLPLAAFSPRNGLLLLKHLGECFNVKRLCFLYNPFSQQLICKVLDPTLMATAIRDSKDNATFDSVRDRPLKYPNNNEPFKRLLSFHARCAYRHALQQSWIIQAEYNEFIAFTSLSDHLLSDVRD